MQEAVILPGDPRSQLGTQVPGYALGCIRLNIAQPIGEKEYTGRSTKKFPYDPMGIEVIADKGIDGVAADIGDREADSITDQR